MARIGLLGGSFNPPHICHLLLSLYALEAAGLDAVWWLPVAAHPFAKPDLRPWADRLALCEAAVARHPTLRVEPIEADLPAPSYTVRTLEALQQRHPEHRWCLLVGADLLPQLPSWHRWAELRDRVGIIAVGRGAQGASGTVAGAAVRTLPVALPELSSSDLRQRLWAGQDVSGWLPEGVARILRERPGLYGPP